MSSTRVDCAESELVRAARGGNCHAFAKVVERYQATLCSIAFAFTGSFVQSEEIAQEAFLVAWRRMPRMRAPEQFRAWLYGIARNVARNHRRKESGWTSSRDGLLARINDVPAPAPSPLDRMIDDEEQRILRGALGRVPEVYRIPLVLFYREEQSIERVAEALNLSEDNVRQRLSRGRRLLQGAIDQVGLSLARSQSKIGLAPRVIAAIVATDSGGRRAAAASRSRLVRSRQHWAAGLLLPTLFVSGSASRSEVAAPHPSLVVPERGRTPAPRWDAREMPLVTAHAELDPVEASSPGEATPIPLLRVDGEDGAQVFQSGQLTPDCPPRPGNTRCYLATVYIDNRHYAPGTVGRFAEGGRPSLFNSETLLVAFDYWLSAPFARIVVSLKSPERAKTDYKYVFWSGPGGVWNHVEIRVAEFFADSNPDERLAPGDLVNDIEIMGGFPRNPPENYIFYVDNVTFHDRALPGR